MGSACTKTRRQDQFGSLGTRYIPLPWALAVRTSVAKSTTLHCRPDWPWRLVVASKEWEQGARFLTLKPFELELWTERRGSSSPSCAVLLPAALQPHLTPQPHPAAGVAESTSRVLPSADYRRSSRPPDQRLIAHHHSFRRRWKQKPQKKPTGGCLLLHHHANGHRQIPEAFTNLVGLVFFSFSPDR